MLRQQRAILRVEENGGCDVHLNGWGLIARCGYFLGEAEGIGAAQVRHGTRFAARRARRADGFAQLHHGLVPIAWRARGQKLLGNGGELALLRDATWIAAKGEE